MGLVIVHSHLSAPLQHLPFAGAIILSISWMGSSNDGAYDTVYGYILQPIVKAAAGDRHLACCSSFDGYHSTL